MRKIPFLELKFINILSLLILLLISGCTKHSYKVVINNAEIEVEIANTPQERERGLMYRTSLKEGGGMLFIHPKPRPLTFWMKNTLIPLSIAFIDEKGRIIFIQDMMPQDSPPYKQYSSPLPAKYALEVPQGWFGREKVSEGAIIKFPRNLEKAIRKSE